MVETAASDGTQTHVVTSDKLCYSQTECGVVNRGEEGGVTAMVVRGCVVDGEVMVGSWKELKRPGEGCFEVTKVSESQMTLQVRKRSVCSCRERKEKWIVYYGVFIN